MNNAFALRSVRLALSLALPIIFPSVLNAATAEIAFNAASLANAGPDQSVALGATVLLDGSASSDTDGDPLTYRWVFTAIPADSVAVLASGNTASPSFVTDRPGTYELQLIVNDGKVDSTPDSVRISTANSAPVANAGPDQTAFVDSTVALDGTASTDVDGDPLGYQWGFTSTPAGSQSVLENAAGAHPSFTVDKPGNYLIQLEVSDGQADGAPNSVQVSTQNSPPVANAGADQTVFVNTTVQFGGNGSHDVDGDPLAYRWSLLNKPVGSTAALVNDTAVNPSFAVDKSGTYTMQLIANDGTVDSASDQVVVSTQSSRPVANAGPDRIATVGGTVAM
ncbi:MAG: PKD domain-containing protein, partial [bacterium]